MRDLEFFIIADNINDANIRKYWEAKYIHLIRNLNFKVIDDHRKIFNLTSFGLYKEFGHGVSIIAHAINFMSIAFDLSSNCHENAI